MTNPIGALKPIPLMIECGNCPYFRMREDLQGDPRTVGAGECRRYPPKVFFNQVMTQQPTGRVLSDRSVETVPAIGYNMQMQVPVVKNDYFCGEHPEHKLQSAADEAGARLDALLPLIPELGEAFTAVMAGEHPKIKPH